MLRNILVVMVLMLPVCAQAGDSHDLGKYLLGKWRVEGIRANGEGKFKPLKQLRIWDFNRQGKLIEILGTNGARVTWHYRVIGKNIMVSIGHMSFNWQVLGTDDRLMLVKTQQGLFKVKRM